MKNLFILLFSALLLSSFSKRVTLSPVANNYPDAPIVIEGEDGDTSRNGTDFKRVGDSIVLPDFEISIKLSDLAEKKLRQRKESIIVMAYYSGIPKNKNNKEYKEEGVYTFHDYSIELTGSRTARFKGVKVSKKMFATLANNDIDVLINVYSGRRSTQDNLLDVDILSEKIGDIKGKTFELKGKLIGE